MLNEPSAKLVETNRGGPATISSTPRRRDKGESELPIPASSARWPEGASSEGEAALLHRSPWDADGYGLSLPVRSAKQPALNSDYFLGTSRAPSHRHSNSHSSTSSCFSSTPSHSRISSTSTFCDTYHLDVFPDASNMESRPEPPRYLGQCAQQPARDESTLPTQGSPAAGVGEPFIHGSSRPASPSDALLLPKLLSPQDAAKVRLSHR